MDVIIICNLTVRFSKFTPKKEIYEKFEEFLSKPIWRETLFLPNEHFPLKISQNILLRYISTNKECTLDIFMEFDASNIL